MSYMASFTVRLTPALEAALEVASKARGVSKSDLAREAIERHLHLEKLQKIRGKLVPYLEQEGIFSEEDVFKRLGDDA